MCKTISLLLLITLLLAACANTQPTPEPTQTATAVIAEVVVNDTAVAPTHTSSPPATPTQTPPPTATATVTITPIPMPAVSIRVLAGTAVPQPNQPISADNAAQLTELARWGRGVINDIDLSGNGRWLAVGTATGVYIHDAQDLSRTVFHLETPTAVGSVAISPDGSVLAINLTGGLFQVWDVQANQQIYEKELFTNEVKFSPDGKQIILNNHDGVYILPTHNDEIIKTYPNADGAEFSPDNEQLAVWDRDLLSSYTWPNSELLQQAKAASYITEDEYGLEFSSEIGDVHFLPENELLMSALPINPAYGPNGHVMIQKASDASVVFHSYGINPLTEPTKYVCNEPIFYWHPPASPVPWQMEVSPNGQIVAFVFHDFGYDNDQGQHTSIRFYQRETEQLLYSIEEGIVDIAISPDGETWVAGTQDGRLQTRSLSNGAVLDSFDGYDAPALNTAVSPDNELVAVEYLKEIKIFNAADGTVRYQYPAHRIAFSPDSKTIALGYDDGRIEIRSLTDNTLLKTIFAHTERVTAVTFLPSGELVSAGLDCRLQIWRPEDGAPIKTLENYIVEGEVSGEPVPVRVWKFSNSQENILVGDFAWTVGFWRIEDGTLLNVLDHRSHSENSATVSNKLATTGYPSLVGQLDENGQFTESWESDDTRQAITFSPDGELLVSGLYSGTLQLFLAETGDLNFEISSHTDQITGLAFAPNGRYFVSVTIDGVVRLWGVP